MMNLFKRKQNNKLLLPELESRDIRIIGPRRAGKTTFLAALSYLPKVDPGGLISVEARDDITERLAEMAEDILETGSDFAPTELSQQPLYSFDISLKPSFRKQPLLKIGNSIIKIRVSCREYAGELLHQLATDQSSPKLSFFIDDCSFASGLILLIDATSAKLDAEYAYAFNALQRNLKKILQRQGISPNDYRIALVFSKCEQSEIWVHRKNIDRFIELKFFETQSTITRWKNDWGCTTNNFFCSAFGMKGSNPPEANVKVMSKAKGITRAVIDSPELWRPFGLVAPLYWLQTGIDDQRFREI